MIMDKNSNEPNEFSASSFKERNPGQLVLDSGRFQAFIQPGGRLRVVSREKTTEQLESEQLEPVPTPEASNPSKESITRGNPINRKYGMLLRRSVVENDLPVSAQPVTDKQLLEFEYNRLRHWEPQREVFIYRHAPHLAGCVSAICATIVTTITRKFFFLGESGSLISMGFALAWSYPLSNMFVDTFTESAALGYGRGSSLGTPAGYRAAPSLLSRIGLADYRSPPPNTAASHTTTPGALSGSGISLQGPCAVCDQMRYVAQQVAFGFVLPTILCPVASMLLASYYRTYPVPSLRNTRECLQTLRKSLTTPNATRGLAIMFALTTFGGALIAEGVRFGVERVRTRDELRLLQLNSTQQLLPAESEWQSEQKSDEE